MIEVLGQRYYIDLNELESFVELTDPPVIKDEEEEKDEDVG